MASLKETHIRSLASARGMKSRSLSNDNMEAESMTKATTLVEDDLAKLGENLRRAELLGDVVVLADVPASDFRGIGPRGFILTKEDWLAKHRTGDLKYEAFERSEITLRTYGDTAIVTARVTRTSRTETGSSKSRNDRQACTSLRSSAEGSPFGGGPAGLGPTRSAGSTTTSTCREIVVLSTAPGSVS